MSEHSNPEASSKSRPLAHRILDEIGLSHLANSPRDVRILLLQRFVRLFAYGGSTLVLVAFLSEVGVSETETGLFMTLTLVGDVLISFCLTLVADAMGRRFILGLGALLMAGSGVVFALTWNYWGLLAAAIFGVITPSGNEIGPFRAIEESIIAHLTPKEERPHIFAWVQLVGTLGVALGLISCGWITTLLVEHKDWIKADAYHLVFIVYAAVGLLKFALTLLLSADCEAEVQNKAQSVTGQGEQAPLLAGEVVEHPAPPPKKASKYSMLPKFSRESKLVLVQLCGLFALDNFASGLAPMSWVTYYFKRRFILAEGKIGTLFFITSIISALSVLVAAALARRIGNVKTMVFTHLPSSICLALVGLPSSLPVAMTLLVLRACTQSMDSAPRSAFLSAVVLPSERTATIGVVNVVKTMTQSLGPLITGTLVDRNLFWVAFLVAGSLKASYDLGMLAMFASHRSRDEESESLRSTQSNGR